jgi:hypothetical protein
VSVRKIVSVLLIASLSGIATSDLIHYTFYHSHFFSELFTIVPDHTHCSHDHDHDHHHGTEYENNSVHDQCPVLSRSVNGSFSLFYSDPGYCSVLLKSANVKITNTYYNLSEVILTAKARAPPETTV